MINTYKETIKITLDYIESNLITLEDNFINNIELISKLLTIKELLTYEDCL